MRKANHVLIILAFLALLCTACSSQENAPGTLQFYANGGDKIRQGMLTKDRWALTFEHFYVTVANATAYQSDPPYDPIYAADLIRYATSIVLDGTHTIDLAMGDAPALVGEILDAPPGTYDAVSWQMAPAMDGAASGYSIVMTGKAEKAGKTVDFNIKLDWEGGYQCGEYFVRSADIMAEKRGLLESGGTTTQEMTFVAEVCFGDGNSPATDVLNRSALGFDPLAALAQGGVLDIDLAGLEQELPADAYAMLNEALTELGHVGEGRCYYLVP